MTRRTFLRNMLIATGVTMTAGSTYAYTSSAMEVSRQQIPLSGLTTKLRIVALSDLHAPFILGPPGDLIKMINHELPDIFILAGDIIDQSGSEDLVKEFQRIKARHAKVATLGNWEYHGSLDLERLRKAYENSGISLLVNATLDVSGLPIVGLDDFVFGSPDYEIIKKVSTTGGAILVISHCPGSFDFLTKYSRRPVLVLSGHTHGGQIAPFGFVLVMPSGSGSYVQGWYHKGKDSMYVMRGIGTTGPPIRIGARPEILVLDLMPPA